MADPKKPTDDDPKQPAPNQIPPEQMTYPTPELDPNTGAPLDTRFQSDTSQEAVAQQPPKSEAAPAADDQNNEEDEEEDDDEKTKSKEKPRRRR